MCKVVFGVVGVLPGVVGVLPGVVGAKDMPQFGVVRLVLRVLLEGAVQIGVVLGLARTNSATRKRAARTTRWRAWNCP